MYADNRDSLHLPLVQQQLQMRRPAKTGTHFAQRCGIQFGATGMTISR